MYTIYTKLNKETKKTTCIGQNEFSGVNRVCMVTNLLNILLKQINVKSIIISCVIPCLQKFIP